MNVKSVSKIQNLRNEETSQNGKITEHIDLTSKSMYSTQKKLPGINRENSSDASPEKKTDEESLRKESKEHLKI